MRAIRQPGPAPQARAIAVPVRCVAIDAELAPGALLLDALAALAAAHGCESACLSLEGGAFGPLGYVIPALSPDARHAAFYSAPFHPPGAAPIEAGCVTLGARDGAPFFHCHAIWTEADGRRHGGHVLPEATRIAAPIRVHGAGIVGARFVAEDDPETGFRLFAPVATAPVRPGNGLALRLRPNQDLPQALGALAAAAGYTRARLAGGVGSIIGAHYADGTRIEAFATEMFVRAGSVPGAIEVGMVDLTGHVSGGVLVAGDNPVLMTLEAVLQAA